jgi:hypothetical protein
MRIHKLLVEHFLAPRLLSLTLYDLYDIQFGSLYFKNLQSYKIRFIDPPLGKRYPVFCNLFTPFNRIMSIKTPYLANAVAFIPALFEQTQIGNLN